MSDLISRMDAIQACEVGPSDEWAKATKSGYTQAATDCARNILRIKPQPDPRDEVIATLVEALSMAQLWLDYDGRYDMQGINAALAAVKAVVK
jgi:hypothetical protein